MTGQTTGVLVPWDHVNFDPAGYFDLANNRLVVPAGHDGLHIIGTFIRAGAESGAPTAMIVEINNGGNDGNPFQSCPFSPAIPAKDSVSMAVNAVAGDTYTVSVSWDDSGNTTVNLNGGVNGCALWVVYLGPLA